MTKSAWITAVAMTLFFALPASAEFYKYRDESGVLRFTDNLAEVPPDQRPNVSTYEGVQTAPGDVPAEKTAGPSDGEQKDAAAAGDVDLEVKEDLEEEQNRLEQLKQSLDKERQELAGRKEALKEERKKLRDERDARIYNEKVEELNEHIAEYEQRRKAFQQQVESLNARQQ